MTNVQSRPRLFISKGIFKCIKRAFFGGGVLLFLVFQFKLLQEVPLNTMDTKKTITSFRNGSSTLSSPQKNKKKISQTKSSKQQDYPFTFAGCLAIKDDNQIIPEWLAYHYTVLPLRYLIVAVDPLSLTSPETIFDYYRDMGMTIEVWYGIDYVYNGPLRIQKKGNFNPHNSTEQQIYKYHRWQQKTFYTTCLRKLKTLSNNYTWTILIDSDEYLTFNNYLPYEKASADIVERIHNGTHCRSKVPDTIGRQNETIAHYIASGADPNFSIQNKPCIVFPRTRFGAKESPIQEISKDVPDGFNVSSFHTLQFRKRGGVDPSTLGKSLVDVSRYRGTRVDNVHRPLLKACSNGPWVHYGDMSLRVHHYTGTMETYLSRPGDIKRKPQNFQKRNRYKVKGVDDSMRGWLREFVTLVGKENALEATEVARQTAYLEAIQLNDDLRRGKNVTPIFKWNS